MVSIIFYGKSNCVNNNKQKSLLRAAGHTVEEKDILSQNWQPDQLRSFFGTMPVSKWFNITAPAIKTGVVLIDTFSEQQALTAMTADPLLIRRPLMEIKDRKICGFRHEQLEEMIGLSPAQGHEQEMATLKSENITTCPFLDEMMENCDERENTMKPQGWREWLEHGRQYEKAGIGKSRNSKFSPVIIYNLFSMALESYCMSILDYHGTLADNHTFTDLLDSLETVCPVKPELKQRILELEKCQQICSFDDYVIAEIDSIVNREFQSVLETVGQLARSQCKSGPVMRPH